MAKFCQNCGAALEPDAGFCTVCGSAVQQPARQPAPPTPPLQPAQQPAPQTPPQQGGHTPPSGVYIPREFLERNAARKGQTLPPQPAAPQYQQPSQPAAPQYQQPSQPAAPQYQQPVQPAAPPYPQAPYQQARTAPGGAAPKRKKSARWILPVIAALLAGVFLFTAFVTPGFLRGGGEDGPGNFGGNGGGSEYVKPPTEKTETAGISKDQPAVTLCGVTLDVIPEMLGDEAKEISVEKLKDTSEDGVRCENYELDFGGHESFAVPIEVTFPCDLSPDTDPTVEHYNETTGEWEPMISFVDEEAGTVTAYFGSFSPARVSYLPIGVNPQIYKVVEDKENEFAPKIGLASNYWKILQRINPSVYSDEINKFIDDPANYAIEIPELDPDMNAEAAYQAFTKANTIWTFCDPMINIGIAALPEVSQSRVVQFLIDNSESLGNAMNAVPFIMMGAQLAYDLRKGNQDAMNTAAANLYKNLIGASGTIYSLTTGYSHLGFTLAFFGVALFGMELDYFVDAAKAEQASNIQTVFETYYKKTAPFNAYHWYEVFEKAYWDNEGDADGAMRAVKKAVDDYCSKFWKEIYDEGNDAFWETLSDSGYKKMFMNASDEQKAMLTEQQKARVWDLIEKHSMKIIQRFLYDRLQSDVRKELAQFVELYNTERTITVKETVNRGAEAELTGYTLCFGTQNVAFPDWHVNIPDDDDYKDGWRADFECTVYGYLRMGMPNQALFFSSEESFRNGRLPGVWFNFFLDMKSKDPLTLVEINYGDPYQAKSDEFTGYDWLSMGYGGEISSDQVNGAIEAAIRKMMIKLDKDGNFNASSSGSSSNSGSGEPGPNDTFTYSASASVTLSGRIDRGTGEGTFTMRVSVTYSHNTGSPYSGRDIVSATITIKGGGEISGEIQNDDTFDPVFSGEVTVTRQGTWSHQKGTASWDEDGRETINATDTTTARILFIANN